MLELHLGRLWAGTEDSLLKLLSAQMPEGQQAFFDDDEEDEDAPSRLVQREGNVGVLHVRGPLTNTDSRLNELFGLTSYNDIRKGLVELAQDEDVEVIMMSLDTPGGAVSGMTDVADLVAMIDRDIKPVVAHTSSLMASAGYFIGSNARHISAGRMADVGSIGVLQVHREASKLEEEVGITTTVIRSGEFKALGNPYEPLSDKAKEAIQASCDYSYDLFVRHVADARGVTPETVRMQMADGKVFTGEQAKAVNLVDEISTFDEALQRAASFAVAELHKSESLPQYGSSTNGLPSMKKATLNPLTVAAKLTAEAVAQEAQASAQAATEAVIEDDLEVETEVVTTEDAETQASGEPAPAEPTAISVLQGQLAQAQEQLLDARLSLREATKNLEAATQANTGLRAVVEQSVQYLRVALNHGASSDAGLSDTELLAEHGRLQKQFDANFKAGGVAAIDTRAEAQEEVVDPVRQSRLKAARLTQRK